MSFDDKQYLLNQQSPPWMSSKKLTSETPEWVDRDEIDNSFTTQPNRSAPREHVIPITFEKSPVKTPNFAGPIPFYGSSQPFHHVISPKTGKLNWLSRQKTNQLYFNQLNSFTDPNANQFVNQGYNDIDFSQQPTQPRPYMQKVQQQPQQQQTGTRIIPIQVEGAQSQQNNTVILQR